MVGENEENLSFLTTNVNRIMKSNSGIESRYLN